MRYCGRDFTTADVEQVRQILVADPTAKLLRKDTWLYPLVPDFRARLCS